MLINVFFFSVSECVKKLDYETDDDNLEEGEYDFDFAEDVSIDGATRAETVAVGGSGIRGKSDDGELCTGPRCPQDFDKDKASLNIQVWETEMASRMCDFDDLLGRADISVRIMEVVVSNGWDLELIIDNEPVIINKSNSRMLRKHLVRDLNTAAKLKNLNWGSCFNTSESW